MRVVGGFLKRRKLTFPRRTSVRPMTDRMKETLFNILGDTLVHERVLDLFSGSGSIGLEAISRGCEHVVFVDARRSNGAIIMKNLKTLEVSSKACVICSDAERGIGRLEKRGEQFGIIFIDPPYNKGLTKTILLRIDQSVILHPASRVIIHHSVHEDLPRMLNRLQVDRSIKIGQAKLSFLSMNAGAA